MGRDDAAMTKIPASVSHTVIRGGTDRDAIAVVSHRTSPNRGADGCSGSQERKAHSLRLATSKWESLIFKDKGPELPGLSGIHPETHCRRCLN